MRTMARLTPLAVLLLLPGRSPGQERDRFADVLALQDAVRQSIERAEPSVACVLVSRSEKYPEFGSAPPGAPGRLGDFKPPSFPADDPRNKVVADLDLSNPRTVPESYGSGVVIDEVEGLVLTLAHVVRRATKIYVRLPGGRGAWADIHAADPRSDLAVLRLLGRVPDLKALKLGDGGKVRKADFVLSLSHPFAAGSRDGSPSASWGIVSNLRRQATGLLSEIEASERNTRLPLYRFGTLIQTDTRMNLGCSGGALLNLRGELVGLTSSLAGIAGGETPGGFAVPLDANFRRILDVLRKGEEVEYGFLGVWLLPENEAPEGHVQISAPVPGGPAAAGGLRGPAVRGPRGFRDGKGDVILSINGTPVHNNDELFLVVGMHLAGSTVRVEVADKPDGPRRICSVTLAKFPVPEPTLPLLGPLIASRRPPARGGLRVDWTSTVSARLRLPTIPRGVAIREVVPGSDAAHHRLQPDMIIHKVNGHDVTTPAEFYREMEKANGPVELTYGPPEGAQERVTINSK